MAEIDEEQARDRLEKLLAYYFAHNREPETPVKHVANVIVHDPAFLQAMGIAKTSQD